MPQIKTVRVFFFVLLISLIVILITSQSNLLAGDTHPLADIPMRSIGPALTSGRVADFAFNPDHPEEHYVAMASGNLWKTENNGITWAPVFDQEGSYAIGVVELDPGNPNTVGWEPAKIMHSEASAPVTAYTARWMAGKHGKIWGWKIPGIFP